MSEQVKEEKVQAVEYISVARVRQHLDKHNINKTYYAAIDEIEKCKDLKSLTDKTKWLIIQGKELFDSEQSKSKRGQAGQTNVTYTIADIASITVVTKVDHEKYNIDLEEFKNSGGYAKFDSYIKYKNDLDEFVKLLGTDKTKEEKLKAFKSKNKIGKVSIPALKTVFDKAKFYVNKLKYRFSPPALSGISFTLDEAEKEILSAGIDNAIVQGKKIIKKEHLLNLMSPEATSKFVVVPLFETLSIARFLAETPIYKTKMGELINAEKKRCALHMKSLETSIVGLKCKLKESKKAKCTKCIKKEEDALSKEEKEVNEAKALKASEDAKEAKALKIKEAKEAKAIRMAEAKLLKLSEQNPKIKNEKYVELTFKHYSYKLFVDVQKEKIAKLNVKFNQEVDVSAKEEIKELIAKIKELKLGDDAKALCSDMIIEFLMNLSVMISDLLPFSKMKTFKSKLAYALIKSFVSSASTESSGNYLSKGEFLDKLKIVIGNKENSLKNKRVY